MIQPLIGNSLRSRVSEKKIKLHDIQPKESLGYSVAGKVCLVCTVNVSSYCCPQCFIPYCSSQCYLRHGADCTEAFSRQRVKAILDLEAKENITVPAADHSRRLQYGKYSDETDGALVPLSQIDLDRNCIYEDESDQNIIDDESTDNNDTSLQADFEELGFAGEVMDVNILKKINPRALSRLVKLWVPWWIGDAPNRVENLNVSRSSSRRKEISLAVSRIAVTAPRLNTLIKMNKVSKNTDIGYQVLGLILGYVVGMHALNGEWQDLDVSLNLNDDVLNNGEGIVTEESSSTAVETTEHSLRSNGRGCYDALEGICSSTPSLDPTFRPCSVLQTVELWIRFRPASLQNISRKNLKSVLSDALSIMKYSEFVRFALIEIWLIALSCELNNRLTQCAVERVKQCLKTENYVDFANVTLSLMDSYCSKFVSKPRNKKTSTIAAAGHRGEFTASIGEGEGAVCFDESLFTMRIQADLLARKSYFLLLYAFDECNFTIMKNVAEELNEYISTYID